jgi:hypothetical protein
MYCSRCGTQNKVGDRFCSSCGASLQGGDSPGEPRPSLGERLGSVIGNSRKAQLATLGTVIALIVAVIAFIALKPSDDGEKTIPRDAYTVAADNMCVAAKQRIVAVERQALSGGGGDISLDALVPVVTSWRREFEAMRVPTDRVEQSRHVAEALRQVEIQLAGLTLATEEGKAAGTLASAKKVDEASTEVEEAVAELGLSHCARRPIALSAASSG